MKKATEKDDKEKRKREKKERKDVKKRDRSSMSAEELLRLDEVRVFFFISFIILIELKNRYNRSINNFLFLRISFFIYKIYINIYNLFYNVYLVY